MARAVGLIRRDKNVQGTETKGKNKMEKETNTIEIAAPSIEEIKPITPVVTRAELKDKGWSAKEMDSAEKRGMIQNPDEKKVENKTEIVKKPLLDKQTPEPERRGENHIPDFTFKTPEQEKAFTDAFGPGTPQRAMYFRMKNERIARQNAEAERDRLQLENQMFKEQKINIQDASQTEVDADGNIIDPEDRPLTMKQLRAMQKAEQEDLNKKQEELTSRSVKVSEALQTQEEYAKSVIPDFEDTVKLAADLVQNLDQIPEKWKRDKVIKLIKELQVTAATADKYGVDDYNAPMISLEIGQLHPKYGQKAEPNGDKADPKANGEPKLSPEQMKRIEENTQRRTSSASLPGSSNGRRVISVEDITIKDVLKMTPEERYKFKRDHPEKMTKLMRG
jgi:hypothetical protein